MIKTPRLGHIDIRQDPDARHLKPINLDTGEELHNIFDLDDLSGHFWMYLRNEDGSFVLDNDTGLPKKEMQVGNVGFDPETVKKYAAVKRENMVVMNGEETGD